jgi:hypothetical protein
MRPRQHPHTEDYIADFVRHRPRVLRSLEGERRATFLSCHLDPAPHEVLEQRTRSLCLVKPDWVEGSFHLDDYSGDFDARLSLASEVGAIGYRRQGGVSILASGAQGVPGCQPAAAVKFDTIALRGS